MKLSEKIEELKELLKKAFPVEGVGAGQVYGLANCSICRELSNDYHFSDHGLLPVCTDCWRPYVHAGKRPTFNPQLIRKLLEVIEIQERVLEHLGKFSKVIQGDELSANIYEARVEVEKVLGLK